MERQGRKGCEWSATRPECKGRPIHCQATARGCRGDSRLVRGSSIGYGRPRLGGRSMHTRSFGGSLALAVLFGATARGEPPAGAVAEPTAPPGVVDMTPQYLLDQLPRPAAEPAWTPPAHSSTAVIVSAE